MYSVFYVAQTFWHYSWRVEGNASMWKVRWVLAPEKKISSLHCYLFVEKAVEIYWIRKKIVSQHSCISNYKNWAVTFPLAWALRAEMSWPRCWCKMGLFDSVAGTCHVNPEPRSRLTTHVTQCSDGRTVVQSSPRQAACSVLNWMHLDGDTA